MGKRFSPVPLLGYRHPLHTQGVTVLHERVTRQTESFRIDLGQHWTPACGARFGHPVEASGECTARTFWHTLAREITNERGTIEHG